MKKKKKIILEELEEPKKTRTWTRTWDWKQDISVSDLINFLSYPKDMTQKKMLRELKVYLQEPEEQTDHSSSFKKNCSRR